jgi:hypothetical protein
MRRHYEENLEQVQKKRKTRSSVSPNTLSQQFNSSVSPPKLQETSILIKSDNQKSEFRTSSDKYKKSVRFQVYDAKTIESLLEMRKQMDDRFNEINDSFLKEVPKPSVEQQRERFFKKTLNLIGLLSDKLAQKQVLIKLEVFEILQSRAGQIEQIF